MDIDKLTNLLETSESRYLGDLIDGLTKNNFSIRGEGLLAKKDQLARTFRIRLKRFSLNKSDYAKELIEETDNLCLALDNLDETIRVYGLTITFLEDKYEYRILYSADNEVLGILKFRND